MSRYSRRQVAISWGGGLGGIFPRQGYVKLGTPAARLIPELLTKEGVYRRHFECAAFRIREDGIRNPGAGATERRVEAEVDASDGAWVGGRIPYPNCLMR